MRTIECKSEGVALVVFIRILIGWYTWGHAWLKVRDLATFLDGILDAYGEPMYGLNGVKAGRLPTFISWSCGEAMAGDSTVKFYLRGRTVSWTDVGWGDLDALVLRELLGSCASFFETMVRVDLAKAMMTVGQQILEEVKKDLAKIK